MKLMSNKLLKEELGTPHSKNVGLRSFPKQKHSSAVTGSITFPNKESDILNSGNKDHNQKIPKCEYILSRKQVEFFSSGPLIGGTLPSSVKDGDKASLSLSLNVLIEYLEIYGFDRKTFRPKDTLDHWELCSQEIGWMKFLKYKFAAFFSFVINDKLPPKPFTQDDLPSSLVGSSAGRFIRCMLKKKNRLEFAIGILYLKKGMPRPDDKAVEKQAIKTYELLTSTHEPSQCVFDDIEYTVDDLIIEVQRTARELFDNTEMTESDLHTPYAPSVKANYTMARSDLGTFGTLTNKSVRGTIDNFVKDEPIVRDLLEVTDYSGEIFKSVKEEQREQDNIPEYELNPKFEFLTKSVYSDVYETVRSKAFNEPCNVQLVGLAESLKVRVISKGPPLTYFTLKPVQKFMHSTLRKHNVFKFIGEPVSEEALLSTFSQREGKFLSVDYSAATDMLNPKLSRAAANQICKSACIPKDIQTLFLKALTGHSIQKPENKTEFEKRMKEKRELEIKPQLWGQLMGSIVSFPILCIVNAAICRRAYEVGTGKPCFLHQVPLMINGDDALLKCTERVRDCWEKLSTLGGLEPSVGKVYFSETYLNINSTSYSYSDTVEYDEILHHTYVNMGLVKGLSRSTGVVGKKDAVKAADSLYDTSIGSRHSDLMKTCPASVRVKTHISFIQNHWEVLKKLRVPWYIPESLGGLGLTPLIQMDGCEDVIPFQTSIVLKNPKFHFFEYNMVSRRDGRTHRLRVGPSELDLKCVRLMMNNVIPFKAGKIPGENPVIARDAWFKNKGFRTNLRFVSQIDDEAWNNAAAIKVSQSDVFTFIDTAAYYLTPSAIVESTSEVKNRQLMTLRRNERAWVRLSNLARFEFAGLPAFEFVAESMSVHPFFCSLRTQGLHSKLKKFQDMSQDQFESQIEQLFDITDLSESLEEGKHKDLIEKLD